MSHRRVLTVSARAFVSPRKGTTNRGITWTEIANGLEKEGGNPVTIFYPLHDSTTALSRLTSSERTSLAKSCDWESIIIEPHDSEIHTFRFFMPSGEEVSFCGHAAIGASAFVANKQSLIAGNSLSATVNTMKVTVPFMTADNSRFDSIVCGNDVELIMNVQHEESDCNQLPDETTLDAIMSEIGLDPNDVLIDFEAPLYVNSSVARPKTLIPIKSVERLNAATAPKDANKFCKLCDSIDSTGIYLYSQCKDTASFQCRQFPRASGYAEDPATGIAAGALAASLYKRGYKRDTYSVGQGCAMGRPSNIQVKLESYNEGDVKLSYTGLVAFDSISCLD